MTNTNTNITAMTQELADAARNAPDFETRRRINVVRLLAGGFTHAEVKDLLGVTVTRARDIEQRFVAQGMDGLRDRRRRGMYLSGDQRAELERALRGPPPAGEVAWSAASVRRFLQQRYDRRVSEHRARALLHAAQ